MLRPVILGMSLLALTGCQPVAQKAAEKVLPAVAAYTGVLPEVPVAGDQVYFLEVPEMSCSSCLSSIVDSLQKTPGVKEVKSSFKDKLLVVGVEKDAVKSLEPLQLAVVQAGFAVKSVAQRP